MMNPTAIITGVSRGLGLCLARRFWIDGYSVVLIGRYLEELNTLIHDLPHRLSQVATPISCNLEVPSDVEECLKSIGQSVPRVDVLVNNAAVQGPIGRLVETDSASWQRTIQVNLLAPVALCKGVVPLMKQSGGGSIVNLSGGGAAGPRPNFAAYATTKAALVRFSETIAQELRSDRIRVNCVAPGAMNTLMTKQILSQSEAAGQSETLAAKEVSEGGSAAMDRAADLVLFLASRASDGITGRLISAVWDSWEKWPQHLDELTETDLYTLRRITCRDRALSWGDK